MNRLYTVLSDYFLICHKAVLPIRARGYRTLTNLGPHAMLVCVQGRWRCGGQKGQVPPRFFGCRKGNRTMKYTNN